MNSEQNPNIEKLITELKKIETPESSVKITEIGRAHV